MARKSKKRHRELIKNLPAVIPLPPPEPEPKDRFGRRSTFKPEYLWQAKVLCEDGATDKELADFFGVNRSTINDWRLGHPEFAAICKIGKQVADDRMERTAYELATGYTTTITEHIKLKDNQGNEVVQVFTREVSVAPNAEIVKWWLKNRRPDDWKDKVEQGGVVEHVHLTLDQARDRLRARLEQIKQKQSGTPISGEG